MSVIDALKGCLELNWPGKHLQLTFTDNKWSFIEGDEREIRSLVYDSTISEGDKMGYVVKGDYITALQSLIPFVGSHIKMIYFDSPRLSTLQDQAQGGYLDSTWLSIVRRSAQIALKLLHNNGFFVLHTDEEMAHYGRMVLDEVFGRDHHITTFAWQKKYAPQNDKNKNNPTDVFDYIIVYSKAPLDEISKIGVLVEETKVIDDGDWRGCYTAGHKGAKSGSEATKFKVNAPPYRWKILESHLPDGNYFFDEVLGVLYFEAVKTVGDFWIKVQATDNEGNKTDKKISFTIRSPKSYDETFELPKRIWWLMKGDNDIDSKGALRIISENTPEGIKGCEYSIVLEAKGGVPITMKNAAPSDGRYWEFAARTLVEHIAKASASFGKKGQALPSAKTYFSRDEAKKLMPVTNWLSWWDFGKSEDATRHIKNLYLSGLTKQMGSYTAKPQKLLSHIISLFAPKAEDIIIGLGDSNAVLSSVALKMNKKFIHITGGSEEDLYAWNNVGSDRLIATLMSKDNGTVESEDEMPIDYTVKNGSIDILRLSSNSMTYTKKSGSIIPKISSDESFEEYYAGLVGGYNNNNGVYKDILNNHTVVVIDCEETLDSSLVSRISTEHKGKIIIVTERSESISNIPSNVTILHAPFDLTSNY